MRFPIFYLQLEGKTIRNNISFYSSCNHFYVVLFLLLYYSYLTIFKIEILFTYLFTCSLLAGFLPSFLPSFLIYLPLIPYILNVDLKFVQNRTFFKIAEVLLGNIPYYDIHKKLIERNKNLSHTFPQTQDIN